MKKTKWKVVLGKTVVYITFGLPLFIMILLTGPGCHAEGEVSMNISDVQKITYHFGDASVPPEYHRSYVITVTAETVRIVVDSYGEILADKSYQISDKLLNEIKESFKQYKIRNCKWDESEGCTGGTSEKISCSDENKEVFSGSVYHCGGENTGNLCGDIKNFANDIKKLIPDLDELIQ